ncbi:hypothetical protein Enr13x_23730 [Stieleria neptunia]|uniref:Uncharacterized protein n=1 Tax=Stieleria neptunia TaxID=2527979 RepID=A0A518HNV0_9BACT|nr:hypothetical protein Enr13x_23730 [Stieleria neptunia]
MGIPSLMPKSLKPTAGTRHLTRVKFYFNDRIQYTSSILSPPVHLPLPDQQSSNGGTHPISRSAITLLIHNAWPLLTKITYPP